MNLGSFNNGSGSLNSMFPKMISITIVIIGLMTFMAMINFDFIPTKQIIEEDEKTILIEGFDVTKKSDSDVAMSKGFCESHKGERSRLQESCSELTKKNCLAHPVAFMQKCKARRNVIQGMNMDQLLEEMKLARHMMLIIIILKIIVMVKNVLSTNNYFVKN